MGKFKVFCCVCKKEIPENHPRFGGLNKHSFCMGCEKTELDVWHVTLPGENGGYYNKGMEVIIDILNECSDDEGYTIKKKKMRASAYYNLPEFDGF